LSKKADDDKENERTTDERPCKQATDVKPKISYQKAMRLQRQARESQIPDDIPVLKRLNQSVLSFEKFKRQCVEYYRFRERLRTKGASLLNQQQISQKLQGSSKDRLDRQRNLNQSQTPEEGNPDQRFSLSFVNKLLAESDSLEIAIPSEYFLKDDLMAELKVFEKWSI